MPTQDKERLIRYVHYYVAYSSLDEISTDIVLIGDLLADDSMVFIEGQINYYGKN